MKLKIISDGTSAGTKLVDESGNEIEGVTSLRWQWEKRLSDGVPLVTIELKGVPLMTPDEIAQQIL
ncbi:MAG TPA: hypothetical protein VGB17_15545 [Pyrinomonadaceae bacterium]|jgi:hypothetical protein